MHIPLVLIDTCVRACSFPRLRLIVIKSKYYFNCIRKFVLEKEKEKEFGGNDT